MLGEGHCPETVCGIWMCSFRSGFVANEDHLVNQRFCDLLAAFGSDDKWRFDLITDGAESLEWIAGIQQHKCCPNLEDRQGGHHDPSRLSR
jgi:hypothetical protein